MTELMTKMMPDAVPVTQPMTPVETDAAFDAASDAGSVYAAMRARADEFKAADKPGRKPRVAGAMTPDKDVLWQGDVGIVRLSKAAFEDMRPHLTPVGVGESHVQIAVGSGVGARHTVSTKEVDVFANSRAGILDGPVIVPKGDSWTLSHPEHQNLRSNEEPHAIRYQRQYAEELRRAQD